MFLFSVGLMIYRFSLKVGPREAGGKCEYWLAWRECEARSHAGTYKVWLCQTWHVGLLQFQGSCENMENLLFLFPKY